VRLLRAVFAMVFIIPVSSSSQTIAGSTPKGGELLANCRVALHTGDKTKEGAVCIAFIQGFNFGYGFAQATRDVHTICVNGDTAMTPVVQHVVDYLSSKNQRTLQDKPASLLVMEALKEAYPCR
jgi:hypothetical protein